MIVGRVRGDGWEAELSEDGTWTCADAFRRHVLRSLFGPEDYSEADGPFGRKLVRDAASRLGGAAELPDPGAIRYPPAAPPPAAFAFDPAEPRDEGE